MFGEFASMRDEITALKTEQVRQSVATAGLSSSTVSALNGLASASFTGKEFAEMNQMKEQISSIVADRLARPCHCVDVDINTSRIALLEQWRDAVLALEASAAANFQTCTAAGFQTYP